jgi:hypothetical protein
MITKKCNTCGLDLLLSMFYIKPECEHGVAPICKSCAKKNQQDRLRQKRLDPQWVLNERKRQREKNQKLRDAGLIRKLTTEETTQQKYREIARNPGKNAARRKLSEAIRWGRLIPKPCEKCGILPSEGHHTDYTKPLDVMWLCRRHHAEIHVKERESELLRAHENNTTNSTEAAISQ